MRFSIVIPVSKPTWFRLTLMSLLNQTMLKTDYEIVIVDDCDEDVRTVLREFSSELATHTVNYIRNTRRHNRSSIRNLGITQATGEIILFLDDDMLASPDLLESHDSYHYQGFDVVITGDFHRALTIWYPQWFESLSNFDRIRVKATGGDELKKYIDCKPPEDSQEGPWQIFTKNDVKHDFERIWTLAYHRKNYVRNLGEDLTGIYIPWYSGGAGNMSVNREAVSTVEGFDENFQGWGLEDIEFEYRLYNAEYRFAFGKRAVAFHQLHARRWDEISKSNLLNFRYFCEKHQSPVVHLFYHFRMRPNFSSQDLLAYNEIARRAHLGTLEPEVISMAEKAYQNIVSDTRNIYKLQEKAF